LPSTIAPISQRTILSYDGRLLAGQKPTDPEIVIYDVASGTKLRTIDTFVLHGRGIASPQRGSQ